MIAFAIQYVKKVVFSYENGRNKVEKAKVKTQKRKT